MPELTAYLFPAFIAGLLTFLAPCTLPLLPAYLGFISGASAKELEDPALLPGIRRRVFFNGVFYVLGFSLVFVTFGLLFGLGGSVLAGSQVLLSRIGGVFVLFFGLYLVGAFERIGVLHRALSSDYRFALPSWLTPGAPLSSFVFGATFAFGWSPCVGPILGSILFLASSSATVWQGGLLLVVFSVGLGLPFLLLAYGIGRATEHVARLSKILPYISVIGGALLIFLGVLLLTESLGIWLSWMYQLFSFINYEALLEYL